LVFGFSAIDLVEVPLFFWDDARGGWQMVTALLASSGSNRHVKAWLSWPKQLIWQSTRWGHLAVPP